MYFNEGNLSKQAILREIDGSLKRLGTDYVDLYIIHRFDRETPVEETMEALDSLIRSGKVRALGASAMYGYQFHNMQLAAERNGLTKFVSMQNHYNLLYREDERELIPICGQYGVARVHELAQRHNATVTQIALAWQFAKGVASPIIGATKEKYIDDAVGAFDVRLTDEDIAYLDAPYVPHRIVGALS